MFMSYAYVCIYSRVDNSLFLIRKKVYGLFFNYEYVGNIEGDVLKFSGQYLLPGGRTDQESAEDILNITKDALRGFEKQTGFQLSAKLLDKKVKSFSHDGTVQQSGVIAYHCLYIHMTPKQISVLTDAVTVNLNKTYEQRRQMGMDDELEAVMIDDIAKAREHLVTFNRAWASPDYGKRESDKSLFAHIVDNLPA